MQIALFVNFDKANAKSIANKAAEILVKENQTVISSTETSHILNNDRIKISENPYNDADICIAVGGDGTIIHTSKQSSKYQKPVLGINLGRIGYLAAIEADELNLLKNLVTGDYFVEERTMLDVNVKTDSANSSYQVFNDAVITKGSLSRIIDIDMFIDSHSVKYRSDGLIISTPTGSTAYSLSAGGPVIDPRVNNILITPICPYTGFTRPLIVPSYTKLTLITDIDGNKEAFLTLDGEVAVKLYKDTAVTVTESKSKVLLISLKGKQGLFSIDKSLKKGVV